MRERNHLIHKTLEFNFLKSWITGKVSRGIEQSNMKKNCLSCHGIQEWAGVQSNNGYLMMLEQRAVELVYLVTKTVKCLWARGPMQTAPVYIPTPGS